MTRIKTVLPVLIAVIIASTIGVVSAVDPVEDDEIRSSFLMAFNNFNVTATYPTSNQTGQIEYMTIVHFDERQSQNIPERREIGWSINTGDYFHAIIADGKTDGNNFEFTLLVAHQDSYDVGVSEIVVNGVCNVSEQIYPPNDTYITFTTTKGTLQISPNEVPSPIDGTVSSFASVCHTP